MGRRFGSHLPPCHFRSAPLAGFVLLIAWKLSPVTSRNRGAYSVTVSSCLFSYYLALLVLLVFLCSVLFLVFSWRLLCSSFSRVPCSFSFSELFLVFFLVPVLGLSRDWFLSRFAMSFILRISNLPVYLQRRRYKITCSKMLQKKQNVSYITCRHVYLNLNMWYYSFNTRKTKHM